MEKKNLLFVLTYFGYTSNLGHSNIRNHLPVAKIVNIALTSTKYNIQLANPVDFGNTLCSA